MKDDAFFILLKPNFANPTQIKGLVEVKLKHKFIVDMEIDKSEPRNLIIAYWNYYQNQDSLSELILYFDDRGKAAQARDFIDLKKKE